MRNLVKKILTGILLHSFLILNVYSDELQDFAQEPSEITDDFSKLSPAKLDDTKVIDESLQELNKAVEYVQKNLESGKNLKTYQKIDIDLVFQDLQRI